MNQLRWLAWTRKCRNPNLIAQDIRDLVPLWRNLRRVPHAEPTCGMAVDRCHPNLLRWAAFGKALGVDGTAPFEAAASGEYDKVGRGRPTDIAYVDSVVALVSGDRVSVAFVYVRCVRHPDVSAASVVKDPGHANTLWCGAQ